MKSLQKALEKSVAEVPNKLLAQLLRKKLLEQGVKVTPRRAEIIAEQLLGGTTQISLPGTRSEPVNLSISQEETDTLVQRVNKFLEKDLSDLILKFQSEMAPPLLDNLRKRWPAEKRRQQRELNSFRTRLRIRWSRGLNKLGMLILMSRDFGNQINQEARASQTAQNADLVDVITRLHARACQVAEEVFVLLENGFANGAMARWRTMHEIAVTAHVIGSHGNACAQRYKEHQVVESYRAAQEYELLRNRLGHEAVPPEELEAINKGYARVLQQYGATFGSQYGWAAADLQMKKPTFKDLESHAGNDIVRGHYRMASHGVHANPKGIFFSLSSMFPTDVLLAGASNAGLADAGDGAARALLVASSSMLCLSHSLDYQVALQAMLLLLDEIGPAFLQAHQKLYRDELELREAEAAGNALFAQYGITEDFDDFKIDLKVPKAIRKR